MLSKNDSKQQISGSGRLGYGLVRCLVLPGELNALKALKPVKSPMKVPSSCLEVLVVWVSTVLLRRVGSWGPLLSGETLL